MPDTATAALVTLEEIREAQLRLHGIAVHTPLEFLATNLNLPYSIHVKREDLQPIGSFKLRGAFNKIAQFPPEVLQRGVITYSSGNHAQGVAYAARALGTRAIIVMPATAPAIKLSATAALGAEIVPVGPSSAERRAVAEELALRHGYTIIPPYDDPQIIAGAATCALEILQDLPAVDCVLAPVGGGGLLSGTATAVKNLHPSARVLGVEPAVAADAAASFAAKHLVSISAEDTARTLADGLRTQSIGVLNLAHLLRYVDAILTVTEAEIVAAMRVLATATGKLPEPSGAVALAAAIYHPESLPGVTQVAVILSGGNFDPAIAASLPH
jgi:threonine dehydratase